MKIAFLVMFTPTTRVVVDVVDGSLEQGDDYINVITAAQKEIINNPIEYLNIDTCKVLGPDM